MTTATIDRRKFLGGSDMAAIVGYSKWRTRLDVWQEKTADEPVLMDNDPTDPKLRAGKNLEGAILNMVLEDHNATTCAAWQNVRAKHHDHHFIEVELDAIMEIDGTRYGVEIKNTSWRLDWGEPGSDEVPDYYRVQALAQLACHDVDSVIFAVLFSGWDLNYYKITREDNDDAISDLITEAVDFWIDYVEKRYPPEPEPGEAAKLFPIGLKETKEATPGVEELIRTHRDLGEQIRAVEKERKSVQHAIEVYMGDAELLLDGRGKKLATWSNTQRRSCNYTALEQFPDIYSQVVKTSEGRRFMNQWKEK